MIINIVMFSLLILVQSSALILRAENDLENVDVITSWIKRLHKINIQPFKFVAVVRENDNSSGERKLQTYYEYFLKTFEEPIIIYNEKIPYQSFDNFGKPFLYIIFMSTPNILTLLDFLHSLVTWHPQAKFIVYYLGQIDRLQSMINSFYEHYVFDVIIVTDAQDIYTYIPYTMEDLNNPDLNVVKIGKVPEENAFYNKRPMAWRNSTVYVTPVTINPYVISVEEETGIDMDLIHVLGKKLGMDLVFDLEPRYDWGIAFSNGSYSGVFKILKDKKTDYVIGHFHLRDPNTLIDFEYTFSYTEDPIIWAVPCPVPISNWNSFILIFSAEAWYGILVILIISLVCWQGIGRITEKGRYFATWYSVEVPFLLFLSLSIPVAPKRLPTKLMYLSSWIFGFIVSITWLSHLTASLTHITYEEPIKSISEIWQRGLHFGVHVELAKTYAGDAIGQYIMEHYEPCNLISCWNRVAYKKDMAAMTTARILRYLTFDTYMSEKGEQLMIPIKDNTVLTDFTVLFFTKGHPMWERVNLLLMWIRGGGFINYFDDHINFMQAITNRRELLNPNQLEIKVLGVEQMATTFAILGIGFITAMFAFVYELCKH